MIDFPFCLGPSGNLKFVLYAESAEDLAGSDAGEVLVHRAIHRTE